jgi:hypothetical protein
MSRNPAPRAHLGQLADGEFHFALFHSLHRAARNSGRPLCHAAVSRIGDDSFRSAPRLRKCAETQPETNREALECPPLLLRLGDRPSNRHGLESSPPLKHQPGRA